MTTKNPGKKPVSEMRLFDDQGQRLYFTEEERLLFLKAAAEAPRQIRSFCMVLHYTGCRISEALALTPARIDLSGKLIVFESLKKRKKGVYRMVPVPPDLVDTLDMIHGIREAQRKGKPAVNQRLFPWTRMTGYRKAVDVIRKAGIPDGPHASPKGLRHGFGINAVKKGIQLNMIQKWMGHAQLTTTAIYANAIGEEEQSIAARMWS